MTLIILVFTLYSGITWVLYDKKNRRKRFIQKTDDFIEKVQQYYSPDLSNEESKAKLLIQLHEEIVLARYRKVNEALFTVTEVSD